MGRFGQVAIKAVELIEKNLKLSPAEAWEKANKEILGGMKDPHDLSCKNTFLGLCEEGLVKGVLPGKYTKSQMNKFYAIKAVKLLKEEPLLDENLAVLWLKVLDGNTKKQKSQMDVVHSLWKEKFIL